MPTENRSSNTEMVSFPRELSDDLAELIAHRARVCGGGAFEIWEAICEGFGQAVTQPHPEPIAWMVGTAIWWTKEEAERDAAAMDLPVVGLGPMTGAGPAEQRQGEPAGRQFYQDGKWWNGDDRIKDHRKNTEDAGYPVRDVFAHTDPGEVERLREHVSAYEASRERLHEWLREEQLKNIALRAQMEEARGLLHTASIRLANWLEPGDDPRKQVIAFLGGGAEPSPPPAPYPNRLCHIDYTAHPYRCGCLRGDEESHCRKASAEPGESVTTEDKP